MAARPRMDDAFAQCAVAIPNELFTAMQFHADTVEVERLYSTLPKVYPISGRKPKRQTEWGEKVLFRHEVNIGFGSDDIRWAFSDHETILGLGLKAVMNVPIVSQGQVLGTINYLRSNPAFTDADIQVTAKLAETLAQNWRY